MSLEDVLRWQPDTISEDHIGNFLVRILGPAGWLRVYYNPPSGSWKSITLYRGDWEYRQVGPKRGVRTIKRPDLIVQDGKSPANPRLFLIEAKRSRDDWEDDLPRLMRDYVRGTDDGSWGGLAPLPFFHRRKSGGPYERLSQGMDDYLWLQDAVIEYAYGFAYTIGRIPTPARLVEEYDWLKSTAARAPESFPTAFMAVAWIGMPPIPAVALAFSHGFPTEVSEDIRGILSPVSAKGQPTVRPLSTFGAPANS